MRQRSAIAYFAINDARQEPYGLEHSASSTIVTNEAGQECADASRLLYLR